jgi:outer membrane protein assembly factor BamC
VQVTVEKNINTVAPADVARRVLSAIQDHLSALRGSRKR